MRFVVDHDCHIHSKYSPCSQHEGQTPEAMLAYAKRNGLKRLVVTDHFWDTAVPTRYAERYVGEAYEDIAAILPLPKDDEVEFLFGCETEMDADGVIGISKERYDDFDFIIVPTTHMHLLFPQGTPAEVRAAAYIDRFEKVLAADLPFGKVGIAHLTCTLVTNEREFEAHLQVIDAVSDADYYRLFKKSAELGLGIELNFPIFRYTGDNLERLLRPYRIAKECGCKFYFGADAHTPDEFDDIPEGLVPGFEKTVDLLGLQEEDKFIIRKV